MKYIILTLLFAVIGCSTNQNKIDVIEARSHNGELLSFEVKYDKTEALNSYIEYFGKPKKVDAVIHGLESWTIYGDGGEYIIIKCRSIEFASTEDKFFYIPQDLTPKNTMVEMLRIMFNSPKYYQRIESFYENN